MCLATGNREKTSTYHNEKNHDEVNGSRRRWKMLSFGHEKCQERERNSSYAKPLYKALYFGALAKTTQATKEMVILVTEPPVSQALD